MSTRKTYGGIIVTTASTLPNNAIGDGEKPEPRITLTRISRQTICVPIIGITPYIPQKWSEKARRMMLESQQSSAKAPTAKKARDPKDPEQDAFDATYWIVPGEVPGAPAPGFKAAIIGAVRQFDLKSEGGMKAMKELLWVKGEGPDQLVPLLDSAWEMHEDTPRNANGNPDLRYRNYVFPWRAVLEVRFPPERISAESIVALVEEAGNGGIGSWRPSSPKSNTGTYGMWRIDVERPIEVMA